MPYTIIYMETSYAQKKKSVIGWNMVTQTQLIQLLLYQAIMEFVPAKDVPFIQLANMELLG